MPVKAMAFQDARGGCGGRRSFDIAKTPSGQDKRQEHAETAGEREQVSEIERVRHGAGGAWRVGAGEIELGVAAAGRQAGSMITRGARGREFP